MPTDPLTASRYPASTASPNVNQDIQNAVMDLSDNTVTGPFASTTARDTAFSQWVAAGGVMRNGLLSVVTGVGLQGYQSGAWRTIPIGMQSGKTTATLSAVNFREGTVTFPVPFAAAPSAVIVTIEVASGTVDLIALIEGPPTATAFDWRVRERAGAAVTIGATLHWLAIP